MCSSDLDGQPMIYVLGLTGVRVFTEKSDGAFTASPGDTGTFTRTTTHYILEERGGLKYRFDIKTLMLTSVSDANGNQVTLTYSQGKLIRLTHSNGDMMAISYNGAGLISQVQDSAGRTAIYTYDAANQHLLSVVRTDGVCSYQYDTTSADSRRHALTRIATPDGVVRSFSYDSMGRIGAIHSSTTPDQDILLTYGPTGTIYADVVTPGNKARYEVYVNDKGQVCRTIDPLDQVSQARYDSLGRLIRQLLPNGSSIDYTYDGDGHLVSSQDTMGQRLTFTYDPDDHWLTGVIDQRGNLTQYQYNDYGNLTAIVHADGSAQRFTYDGQGNLTSSANRRGQVIAYSYNSDGLLTGKLYQDGSQDLFTYDARGNLITATDDAGVTIMQYDAADRMTRITYPNGRFLQYTYDAQGRRTRMEDQDGFIVNYFYDSAGRLFRLTDASDAIIVRYFYDARSRLVREDKGNGTYTTYEYDGVGQLLHLINHAPDGSVNSRFDYTYDVLGRRTAMQTLDGTWQYQYDPRGLLTRAVFTSSNPEVPDQDLTYVYDPAGNRIATVINGETTNYGTNDLNQYIVVGNVTYVYDADGNLTGKTDGTNNWTYAYDSENRLIEVVTPNGTWQYEYDIFGQKTAIIQDGARTEYLCDPFNWGIMVAEYNTVEVTTQHYSYGFGLENSVRSGSAYYYDFDATGHTSGMSGSDGGYANSYSYQPFGEVGSSSETASNSFTQYGQGGFTTEDYGLTGMAGTAYDSTVGQVLNSNHVIGDLPADFGQVAEYWCDMVGGSLGAASGTAQSIIDCINNTPFDPLSISMALNVANALKHLSDLTQADPGSQEGRDAENLLFWDTTKLLLGWYPPAKGVFIAGDILLNILYSDLLGDLIDIWSWELGRFLASPNSSDAYGKIRDGIGWLLRRVFSWDPNDITGPQGVGIEHWIAGPEELGYTIRCENDAEKATAPAQTIRITQQLDEDLDSSTFRLGDFGFGLFFVDVPDDVASYEARLDVVDALGIYVDVKAGIHLDTGVIFWELISVDPETGDLPWDPFRGILAPNHNPPEGDGWFTYTVSTKTTVASGDRVDAEASIVFDTNDPIDTPAIFNTLDIAGPTSAVDPLPAEVATADFTVSWSGQDDADGTPGSGIASYDIYVSDNGAAFVLWLDDTSDSSATFTGQDGHTYAFYCVAADNVGHVEDDPGIPEAQTIVGTPLLRLTHMEAFSWGFVARFNRPLNSSVLNLYDTATAGYGPADVTVVGMTVGSVAGSLVVSDDGRTVTFVKTGSPLEADTYTLTFRSATNGFRGTEGHLLDGDQDGFDGGDCVTTLTVASSTVRWVSVPDFCRGPGQAVDVPATGAGIPIKLSNGTGVQAADFVLEYDPALLTITGVSLGAGLPATWSDRKSVV